MRAVIVPLTLLILLFIGYLVWQVRSMVEQARRDKRAREKEREDWSDRMMGDDK